MVLMLSYILVFPGMLLKNNFLNTLPKKLMQTYLCFIFKNFFDLEYKLADLKTNMNKINENTDKIDVIIANHISTIDFLLIYCYLNCFNIDGINFVLRDGLLNYPGLGLILYANSDIKVKRKWEEDKETLNKQIDMIELNSGTKQVIVIFCEGTRMTDDKLKEGQQFSKDNNYPIYNNLLVPKSKGIHTIINHLNKNNKLGKVWDLSLIIPKFLGKSCFMEDLSEEGKIGEIYSIFRELDTSTITDISDNIQFKAWLLERWKEKDDMINIYKTYEYKKLPFNENNNHYIFLLIIATMGYFMINNKYGRSYLYLAIIISYIMIFFRL